MLLLVEPISGLDRSEVGVETVEGHDPEASETVVLNDHDRPGLSAVDTASRRGVDVASPHYGWGCSSCAQSQEIAWTNA
jgi:hypothetical protein